jgi:hypothetical protein
MTASDEKDKTKEGEVDWDKHVCAVCGKKSRATICHACEDRLRGEALEHKRDVEKGKA